MYKWLIFVTLKVLEIGAVVFVPYWVGVLVERIPVFTVTNIFFTWLMGVCGICLLGLFCGSLFILAYMLREWLVIFIDWNLELTEKIMRWFK